MAEEAEIRLEQQQTEALVVLEKEKSSLVLDLEQLEVKLGRMARSGDYEGAVVFVPQVRAFAKELGVLEERAERKRAKEMLYSVSESEVLTELTKLQDAFRPFKELWEATIEFQRNESEWMTVPVTTIDAAVVKASVDATQEKARRLSEELEELPHQREVAEELLRSTSEFAWYVPILQALCAEAMQERHWVELVDELALATAEGATFQDLLEHGILDILPALEKIVSVADNQWRLQRAMVAMRTEDNFP